MMEVFAPKMTLNADGIFPLSAAGDYRPVFIQLSTTRSAAGVYSWSGYVVPDGSALLVQSLQLFWASNTSVVGVGIGGSPTTDSTRLILGSQISTSSVGHTILSRSRCAGFSEFSPAFFEGETWGTDTTTTTNALKQMANTSARQTMVDAPFICAIDQGQFFASHYNNLTNNITGFVYCRGLLVPRRVLV